MFRHLLAGLAGLFLAAVAHAQSPVGTWQNEKATFEIYDQGGKLYGKIVTLKNPNDKDGKPKVDKQNPDASKQSTPIQGMTFLRGFTAAGNGRWENGTIYDPEKGKTYSSYMQMEGNDKIEVRGYIGVSMIGRSQNWTRVK